MSAGALHGLRVLDLTRYIPGPYCTMLLGDLGADVVKVEEPPFGDATRALPPAVGEESATHAALNRNKRSIVVDIRRDEGAALVRRLAARADVLVEAYRPGTLAKRGLGAERLLGENPRLVYCSLTGYGQDGPHAGIAGHDVNYIALGGFLGANRDRTGQPILPVAQVADMTGAFLSAIGILAALQARARTGRGQVVDVSLLDGVLALMSVPLTRLMAGGTPGDELAGSHACYNAYRCKDGRALAVGALEPKFWEGLCRQIGRPDLIGRQWSTGARQREVVETLTAIFATRNRDEWVRELRAIDACVEPVLDLNQTVEEPQVQRSLVEQPAGGERLRTPAPPLRLSETRAELRRPAPGLGQHTDEVLAEVGLAPAEIAALREGGVVA